jgi:hypothetical protein
MYANRDSFAAIIQRGKQFHSAYSANTHKENLFNDLPLSAYLVEVLRIFRGDA